MTFVAATSCAPLLGTDPLIRGTVVDVGNGWLDVRHKSGRVVRVLLTTSTDVTQGRAVARIAFVRAGQRTMIKSKPWCASGVGHWMKEGVCRRRTVAGSFSWMMTRPRHSGVLGVRLWRTCVGTCIRPVRPPVSYGRLPLNHPSPDRLIAKLIRASNNAADSRRPSVTKNDLR